MELIEYILESHGVGITRETFFKCRTYFLSHKSSGMNSPLQKSNFFTKMCFPPQLFLVSDSCGILPFLTSASGQHLPSSWLDVRYILLLDWL